MLDPKDRQRILQKTGLCLGPNCTAHDRVVLAILELEKEAHKQGFEQAVVASIELDE